MRSRFRAISDEGVCEKMSHGIGWASDSPTPAQLAEFFRQIQSGRINKYSLQGLLRGERESDSDYKMARSILGKDFIGPEEISKAIHVVYSEAQLHLLKKALPSRNELQRLRDNNFMLVVGPSMPVTLNRIKQEFCPIDSEDEEYSHKHPVEFEWIELRKAEFPGSLNKKWDDYSYPGSPKRWHLSSEEEVPGIAEVAWGFIVYKMVNNIALLDNEMVLRTSSIDSTGNHVLFMFRRYEQEVTAVVGGGVDLYAGPHLGIAARRTRSRLITE